MMQSIEHAAGSIKRVVAFRLKPGMDVLKGIEEICKAENIKNGVILSGIGSLDGAAFCNPVPLKDKKAGYGYGEPTILYGPIELTAAAGMICHDDDGNLLLHVHMSMSDQHGTGHGGHLIEGTKVLLTTDMVIAELDGLVMGRRFDEGTRECLWLRNPSKNKKTWKKRMRKKERCESHWLLKVKNIRRKGFWIRTKQCCSIRAFETKAAECFTKGMLAGNIHLCIGQEAVPTGACYALEPEDYMTSTHRGHGHCIAKGASLDKMLAELFGKKTGYCQGKGGSMHIADVAGLHSLGANGIVGAGIPIAAGSALVSKIKGDKHVTLCFFGDSASNQGTFHEAVNMAAAWKLPVVFLCENNSYGVSVNIHSVTNTDTIAVRAQAYNIPGKTVDGNDPVTVYEAVKEAVDYAREGNGPSIVECMTFRHQGHYCGDPANYRPASYMEEAHKKDAIPNMRKRLLDGVATEEEILAVEKAVEDEMDAACQFANESAYPDPSEATTDVYFSDNERSVVR